MSSERLQGKSGIMEDRNVARRRPICTLQHMT